MALRRRALRAVLAALAALAVLLVLAVVAPAVVALLAPAPHATARAIESDAASALLGPGATADADGPDDPPCTPRPELYNGLVLALAPDAFVAAASELYAVPDRDSATPLAFVRTGAGYALRTPAGAYVARDGTLGGAADAASVLVGTTPRSRTSNELTLDPFVVRGAAAAGSTTVAVATPDQRATFFVCNTLAQDAAARAAAAEGDVDRARGGGGGSG